MITMNNEHLKIYKAHHSTTENDFETYEAVLGSLTNSSMYLIYLASLTLCRFQFLLFHGQAVQY
jgi:hypothetical protein